MRASRQRNRSRPAPLRKGIYLLPNLFTTAALFAGFYSVVAAMDGEYRSAAIAVFVAMILDGVDGRVARMTNTQSDFGKEYDSLADMVSFGLAPALVVYEWGLELMAIGAAWGKLGWLAAFFFAVAAALRLARFNSRPPRDSRFFEGLPSPSAAALVAGWIWLCTDLGVAGIAALLPAFAVTVTAGALMVSGVRYYSFKEYTLGERVSFAHFLLIPLVFVLISLNPPVVLFMLFATYTLTGMLLEAWRRLRRLLRRPDDRPLPQGDDGEADEDDGGLSAGRGR